jgi:membrane-bound lytic murein transglycosylase A
MKILLYLLGFLLLFSACSTSSKKLVLPEVAPYTPLEKTTFASLPEFDKENFDEVLQNFRKNCQSPAAQKRFVSLCQKATNVTDAKSFIVENFTPYKIVNRPNDKPGLLTGYYEAQINASYKQDERYKYPVYATPKDLVMIDLSAIYPELKHYRLRGRVEGNKVVPYFSRKESQKIPLDAEILCYCDSKIDKFFLEIQGSGIAKMDDNSSIYIGYANQNGHKYRAIGRYLIKIGALKKEEVSLQSIRKWLEENPQRVDEVLNYNKSLVFFAKRDKGATGALGIELTPYRSVAVDKKYIPLGNMIYLHADLAKDELNRFVFAQDTGGAIKGAVRADLFVGNGVEAMEFAGELKAPLTLWIIVPKKGIDKDE